MKVSHFSLAALVAGLLAGAGHAAPAVTGDYVESRSANVYVGACHHEGEVVSTGRNAVLAWNVQDGSYRGVSLAGVSAVAVVAADRYLDLDGAQRQSVLYVSDRATAEQKEALTALVRERAGKALGDLVAVKSAPVRFDAAGEQYRVDVSGVASLKVRKQTAELCCKQPYQVWGKPLMPVKDAKAGYSETVEYRDASFLKAWSVSAQNSSFFGRFSL